MSEHRRVFRPLVVLAALGALLATGAPGAAAQAGLERELRARANEARLTTREARDAFLASRRAATASLTDTLVIDGLTLRWPGTLRELADVDGIVAGIRDAQASLARRFGTGGTELVAGAVLDVRIPVQRASRTPRIRLAPAAERAGQGQTLSTPVERAAVRRYVLDLAGTRLRESHAALRTYPASALSLDESSDHAARAARSLATGESAPGRRCARGSVSACRAILTHAEGEQAKALWYDREDDRSIVFVTQHHRIARDRTTLIEARKRCLADGDAPSCRLVVQQSAPHYPFTWLVRGSFIAHAIEMGGADGLARLKADTVTRDPIALLARVAALPEDSLIASWQRAGARAVEDSTGSLAPLTVAALFWCGIFFFGATRRRPR